MPQPPISERAPAERSSPDRSQLAPPRISSRLIAREALLSQLMAARRHRCVVLQGPGGCGKTTTVAAWRQALLQHNFTVAWLGLTDDDNAPAQLFDALLRFAGSKLSSDSVTQQVVGEKRDDTRQALDAVWEEEQVKFIEDNATACDSSPMQQYQRRFSQDVAPQYVDVSAGGPK